MNQRLSLLVVVLLGLAAGVAHGEAGWKAGAGSANITPPQFMWMSGYASRSHPADGKLTDLWAKALVLEDGAGKRSLLITLDLVGIGRGLSQRICESLSKQGWSREQIAICTSHTHTGPVVGRNLLPLHFLQVPAEQRELIRQYADLLHDRVLAAAARAAEDLGPATLKSGQGTAGFAVNRRENRPEAEVPQRRAAGQLKGPVDHQVPVLAVYHGPQLRAAVFGYACHATVLSSYQWSGDYPGFAQQELQRRHPGCQAMFWAGCGGDQNPLPRRSVELARQYGRQLADAVDQVLDGDMAEVAATLDIRYREIDLAFDKLPTREQWQRDAQSSNRYVAARGRLYLQRLDDGQSIQQAYPYPVATWRIGDVHWVFLGGEVVVDYSMRIKTKFGGAWVTGYANDVMAYIPSRRVLLEGGYEGGGAMVYYGLPTAWSQQVEEQLIAEVVRQAAP